MEDRNKRIKDFYGSLWYVKDTESLKPTDTFHGSFKIERTQVEDFNEIIGNRAEIYSKKEGDLKAPMDFAIVVGWKPIVTAILPKEIDGDLLRLVHLSNEFRMLDNNAMLAVGDEIMSEAKIDSISINESGKTIFVRGILSKLGKPVVEVLTAFLYRGIYYDYENTFSNTTEKPMQVVLKSKRDIAVLEAKKWIKWNISSPALVPNSILIFRLQTFSRNKNSSSFSEVKTFGSVFLKTTRETIEIGKVDYHTIPEVSEEVKGNIVLEYLARNGTPIEQAVSFKTGGYSILPDQKVYPATVSVPLSNEIYASSSGDLNPIHVNPYFASLAGLPGTITHGMWTSASSRKFVEIFAANNQPQRVKAYQAQFMGMVFPGDQLETKLFHIGMINGRKLIKIETTNQNGDKVLVGSAEVEQPTTAYVFTGQGSQEVGMGMDLYESSPIAREVWDRADLHMLTTYGVSILEIVRTNPKSITLHFGGKKGGKIRDHYRSMTYDVLDPETKKMKSMPLFPTITDSTPSFTFSHLGGLLSATQFTQPALTLMEIASFQDLKSKGLVHEDCSFAGHSLGEYAGLSAVGGIMAVEALVDVVFYRGMAMQVAVARDAKGRSGFGMCAVSPARVGPTFGAEALGLVVSAVAYRSKLLLEIVNYNVENEQYVVAGLDVALEALRLAIDRVKALGLHLRPPAQANTGEASLDSVVDDALASAHRKKNANGGHVVQERGAATIPLPGIDVPFHSSFLLSGILPFREVLRKKIDFRFINVDLLLGKYIPNLTAIPFSLSKEYIQNEVLDNWNEEKSKNAAELQQLGHILLIELLAHHFASPVQWIGTQDRLFRDTQVERLIEVGPSPVLCGMAQRTLKIKYEAYDDAVTRRRVQLCTTRDKKDIYYDFEDAPVEIESGSSVTSDTPAIATPIPVSSVAVVAVIPLKPAGPIEDAPISAGEIMYALIANKLKKPISEILPSKSIKDLVGGKSTLQNEILGDFGAEFGNVLADKSEELPLSEVATALSNTHSGTLGKTSKTLVSKLISGKMPAGFGMGQVKSYLTSKFGLGPKRIDGLLLHSVVSEPPARLTSEVAAKDFFDASVASYAVKVGISLSSGPIADATAGSSS
ncbi:3-oxoacyl-[acyl-carrier-protein] synthase, partial [Nowakowskiella sp. JEL0078]